MNALARLLDLFFPPRTTEMLVRAADTHTLALRIQPTTIPSIPFPTTALFSYNDALIQALIVELKFHRNRRAGTLLGSMVSEYLAALLQERGEYANASYVLVPIPLSQARRKRRGYNQLEEILKNTALPPFVSLRPDVLARTKDTAAQTTLTGTKRFENMQGAFRAAVPDPKLAYIVFDDVTTTGATLQAAVHALIKGGAKDIIPLALAH